MSFNIIIDTREQQPWVFAKSDIVDHTIVRKLDTGDYTIDGFEDLICIERKKSVAELASNIVEKRFTDELIRMSEFKYKFLLLEFDYYQIDSYPIGSNIPLSVQRKIRINGPFIIKKLSEIQIKYGVHVITCGNVLYAENIALSLMKEIYGFESRR